MLARARRVVERETHLARRKRHAGVGELAVRTVTVQESRVEVEALGAEERGVGLEDVAREDRLPRAGQVAEPLARLVRRLGLAEVANDRLEQRPVARPRAARVLEHAVRELVLERGDALRIRARRGLVVHQGAPVVARALVGVGEPRMHVGGFGRIRLAREELLAAVDDPLVRHGVVPPRLPAPREHANHVEHAD